MLMSTETDVSPESRPCPCTSGKQYDDCCQPFLSGKARPESAEALMRSRYSAYAMGEIEYLLKTIPLIDRKHFDMRAAKEWSQQSEWTGLEILSTKESANGTKATIEFKAKFKVNDEEHVHAERAYFEKTQGRWFFLDGKLLEDK
jgi:SEC-C motif domain protein